HTDYLPNDYDTFEDIKVGVFIRAKPRVEAFHQFCKANNLHLTPVYFDDAAAWEEAFATGAVDAQLTSSAKLRDDEKIIANFRQESYYFGVAKGNDDVLRELNHALGQINQINPHFDSNLYMKYFGADSDGEFSLSSAEKRFVREHPVLRITAAPDWRPISYTDENGHFRGISADVMDVLHQKTGFQLEYVPAESFRHALSLLESNQADLMVGATEDGLGSSHKNLAFSLPYLPIQTVILHQTGKNLQEIPSPVMACVYGFEYEVFSQARRQNYDTALAAIEAVKNGEADFTVISSLTADHYFLNNGKSGLVLVPVSNTIPNLSIALNTPANPTLLTILDRAIHSINSVEQQSIIFQNTSVDSGVTFKGFVYANPMRAILAIVCMGLLGLVLLFLFMNMRLRLSRKAALISDTYRIIGELSDEYIFAYDFEIQQLSLPERFATLAGVNLLIRREDCRAKGICQLLLAFEDSKHQTSFSTEFSCPMADGSSELFRAICMVIYDNIGRPVRGIGKLVSIQAEFDEKQQLEKIANTDALTGLYSKSYCEQWAERVIESGDIVHCGALLLIDIDNFKDTNDTLGHLGGDEALKFFARLLESVFTDGAVLGRWGGDEFIVFINQVADPADIESHAKRLCAEANCPFRYQDT
ncbi:MAG: transporter substrate-binding domain-containing protein, partial [Oscillibacter sp.]